MDTNLFRSGFLASPCHGIIDIKCGEYEGFNPQLGEKIFDKTVNSFFMGTGFVGVLGEKNIRTVAVVGLQTDYGIDATIKSGFENGFKMIISKNANST